MTLKKRDDGRMEHDADDKDPAPKGFEEVDAAIDRTFKFFEGEMEKLGLHVDAMGKRGFGDKENTMVVKMVFGIASPDAPMEERLFNQIMQAATHQQMPGKQELLKAAEECKRIVQVSQKLEAGEVANE